MVEAKPEMEFLDINLIKRLRSFAMEFLDITIWQKTQVFFLHAIYSLFYWRILQ